MEVLQEVRLHMVVSLTVLTVFFANPIFCCSSSSEGMALLKFRENVYRDPYGALSSWVYSDNGDMEPCTWFGVECSNGKVAILNLVDLCLEGTLAPEIRNLAHLRSLILRNNSFWGKIPKEIGELTELEILDLRHNNFSGTFPLKPSNNLPLKTQQLDNNQLLSGMNTQLQMDENKFGHVFRRAGCNSASLNRYGVRLESITHRRLMQVGESPSPESGGNRQLGGDLNESPSPAPAIESHSESLAPSMSPSNAPVSSPKSSLPPSPFPLVPAPSESPDSISMVPSPSPTYIPIRNRESQAKSPDIALESSPSNLTPTPAPTSSPHEILQNKTSNSKHLIAIICVGVGGSLLILFSVLGVVFLRGKKVVTVKPWATGLSGQLQKAFVTGPYIGLHKLCRRNKGRELPPSFTMWHIYRTNFIFQSFHSGVPKLNRSELEAACEDFSNVIGNLADGTVYKGTLSSGVEIAVTSTAVKSSIDWSKTSEAQFRKKIDTLSKMNHKNFVNLIGYCEEEKPFTRMMVFEYAPNGTLFEHLHIKEAEHLDWGMRLRIAMGMAYCLEYMHQLSPPVAHQNLHSSSVYLTEDYAAKISDFSFWNDFIDLKIGSAAMGLLESPSVNLKDNVYSLGLVLFEMITGKMSYSLDNNAMRHSVSRYLTGMQPLKGMVDPTLKSFEEGMLIKLLGVVKECLLPDPQQRPRMQEITASLQEITAMDPGRATPKSSPLWWAELEIMSPESSEEGKYEHEPRV